MKSELVKSEWMNEWIRLVVTHSSYLLFLGKNSYFKILQGTERN